MVSMVLNVKVTTKNFTLVITIRPTIHLLQRSYLKLSYDKNVLWKPHPVSDMRRHLKLEVLPNNSRVLKPFTSEISFNTNHSPFLTHSTIT